jgi:hypothetical protein
MTRSYVFTLANKNTAYNLWSALILPTFTDPSFGNTPFVPNMVSTLKYQNLTSGATVRVNGSSILSGASGDMVTAPTNCIDLGAWTFTTDTDGSQIEVIFISK